MNRKMLAARLYMALFGWRNPETYREYKRLLEENKRLRRALREADRRERRDSRQRTN